MSKVSQRAYGAAVKILEAAKDFTWSGADAYADESMQVAALVQEALDVERVTGSSPVVEGGTDDNEVTPPKKASMWINKSESMPVEGQLVLLCWPSKAVGGFMCTGGWNFDFFWGSTRWGHQSVGLATHWMPWEHPPEGE